MNEELKATIKMQHTPGGVNFLDSEHDAPIDADVLDGEVMACWVERDGAHPDNLWRQPQQGYIRVKVGEIIVLRLSGADAIRLDFGLSHRESPRGLPPGDLDAYWDVTWVVEGRDFSICISDSVADELQESLAWLTEGHPYREF